MFEWIIYIIILLIWARFIIGALNFFIFLLISASIYLVVINYEMFLDYIF